MRLYREYEIELTLEGHTWTAEVSRQDELTADGKTPGDALRALAELFDETFDDEGLDEDD